MMSSSSTIPKEFSIFLSIGSTFLPPDRIHGIRVQQIRKIFIVVRPWQPPERIGLEIFKTTRSDKVLEDHPHALEFVELLPDPNCLGRKPAIGKGHDEITVVA